MCEKATVKVASYDLAPLDSIANCAPVLGLSERQVRRMCERGELKAKKLGKVWRINTSAMLDAYGL